jgi:ABC-2 type transport system ATP-binding protein
MNSESSVTNVIEVRDVHHAFKAQKALRGISFQVAKGAMHGFVGPNGAGKTTALKLVCTLLSPQRGSISVFELDVVQDVKRVRRRIGFMPDHFSMYRQMTVFEYLDFFGAAYGLVPAVRDRVIVDVLELTDMAGRRNSLINSLSRGMQQRVSLARVLVNDPQLLLLDEPASGLDPRARIELMDILRALREMGKTIFISSHILSELAELCNSVTIIDRGTIKYSGSMDKLLERDAPDLVLIVTLSDPPEDAHEQLSRIPEVAGVSRLDGKPKYRVVMAQGSVDSNRLLRGIIDAGLSLRSFAHEQKHLNQAFMDLTEGGVG